MVPFRPRSSNPDGEEREKAFSFGMEEEGEEEEVEEESGGKVADCGSFELGSD